MTWLTHWCVVKHRELRPGDELHLRLAFLNANVSEFGIKIIYEDLEEDFGRDYAMESIESCSSGRRRGMDIDYVTEHENEERRVENNRVADWYKNTFRGVDLSQRIQDYKNQTSIGAYICFTVQISEEGGVLHFSIITAVTYEVRNLGKPVQLAQQYYKDGADEVSFLNITGFRDFPLGDLPMLQVLRITSENVFLPLTVGGGIRDFTDGNRKHYSSLEVASEYFRSGADKISIGSDAVKTGKSSLEQISRIYGNQAVVVSIDPRRCTVNGGREGRDIGAFELAKAVEELGAGEILLNCIDCDGQGKGFDIDLIKLVSDAVSIPVIASSGAGAVYHFSEVFQKTNASAALAAGIFHRKEVPVKSVKEHLLKEGIEVRL
ncbi:unnamed protein product [Rhodiola kirilowii]